MSVSGNQLLPLYVAKSDENNDGITISMWDTVTLSGTYISTHISVAGVGARVVALESKLYDVLHGSPYAFYMAGNETRTVFSMQQYVAACGSVSYSLPGQQLLNWTSTAPKSLKSQLLVNATMNQDNSLIISISKEYVDSSMWIPFTCTACEAYNPNEDYSCSGAGECFNFTFSLDVWPQCSCTFGYQGDRCQNRSVEYYWIVYVAPISATCIVFVWFIIHLYVTSRSKRMEFSPRRAERTIELEKEVLYRERKSVAVRRTNLGISPDAPLFGVACSGGRRERGERGRDRERERERECVCVCVCVCDMELIEFI